MLLASSLWIGGAESVILHLAKSLDRRRFRVLVCHLKDRGTVGEEIADAGVDVVGVRRPGDPPVDYLSFLKLRKIIAAHRIEVVHTHTTHGLTDACLCKLSRPGLKVVHTFHFGNYPHTHQHYIWLERLFSHVADRLFAVGEFQRRQIMDVHGIAARRIGVVHNGVTLPEGSADTSLRERIGAGSRIVIGTIATLIRQKGLDDLLQVARRVRDAGCDALFVVVGEGHLREELEAQRRALGLEDAVVITGWITDAAAHALPAFDVFFQPSRWEAMSVVILEAMAAGKPIVATRVGENPLVLEDRASGLLVDAGDVAGMAEALCALVRDAGMRARLGASARARVAQKFTTAHMTEAYERVYEDLCR